MGGGTPLVVNEVVEGGITRLDKTWQEIHDAPVAWLEQELTEGTIERLQLVYTKQYPFLGNTAYEVYFASVNNGELAFVSFTAETADSYPQGGGIS